MDQKTVKYCTKCKKDVSISFFDKDGSKKDGYYSSCKAHRSKHDKAKKALYDKIYRSKRGLNKRANQYKITVDQLKYLIDSQKGLCAIHKGPETALDMTKSKVKALAVDHDKNTGEVRGLLCQRCNIAIGLLNHDVGNLLSAIEYLRKL